MKFKVYRDFNSSKLLKICVELWDGELLVDRVRMFGYLAFLSFPLRLWIVKLAMLRMQRILKDANGEIKRLPPVL